MKDKENLSTYFISGCRAGTTFEYRVLQKQEQLSRQGIPSVVRQTLMPDHDTMKEMATYGLLYLYRVAYNPRIGALIRHARARGIPVVFDTDDLVFEPEVVPWIDAVKTMAHEEAAHHYEGVWHYRRTLQACDYVVTSTRYLAELAQSHGKRAFVHRNGLSQRMIETAEILVQQRETNTPHPLVIGYGSGTDTHRKDLGEIAKALGTILSRHPDVELHIVGPMALPESLQKFGARIKRLPLVPWEKWLARLNTFDINLAPLERENPYCQAKSEIKYTEAALLAIPTVASRTAAFEFAIRDGETGFIAEGPETWIAKLEQLVTDATLRTRMGEAARADVLARYTPTHLGHTLVQTLATIQEAYAQQKIGPLTTPDAQASSLVLNWIFPEPIPGSGGYTDIIRMINLLASFGHHINAYVVPKDKLKDKSELEIRDFIRRHFTDLDGFIFKWTGDTPMTQADAVADATIVTHWTTAYLVDALTNAAKVFYFVQDWEPFFFPMGTSYLRAEQTYKMGFSCITLGRWLTEHLRSLYDADADYFDFAVDHTIYYPRAEKSSTSLRLCFYARPSTPRRLFPLGIAALEIVAQQRPDVEIVLYGAEEEDLAGYHIPFSYTNLGILTQDELAELFSSSDIGIVFSSTNCSLVPPEMMACQCAIVDLNRETVRGILTHEVNALLAEPTPEAVAEAIVRLLDDEDLRQRLVETAHQQIQGLSWVHSARMVEKILYKKLPRRGRVKHQRQAPLPALADFPEDQQKHLNAIHATRQQWRDKMQATIKTWGKRLLNTDSGVFLNGKPVQILGELTDERRIGQRFTARHDNLYRIDVLVATYRRRNTRDVILHLKTSPTATQDLATVRVNACLLTDYHYASFTFDPQPTSRGETYYFEIESPESIPGDAVTLWIYKDVDLPEAKLYKNGQPSHGQIIFGLHYIDEHVGEIEEQPLLHEWWRLTASWQRLEKAYQVFTMRGIQGLIQEIVNYWKWKMGKT